jgi:membrane-associated phospholipid phosphatase
MQIVKGRVVIALTIWWLAVSPSLSAQTDRSLAKSLSQSFFGAAAVRDESPPAAAADNPEAASPIEFGQAVQKPAGPPPTPRHTGIKAMLRGLGTDVKHLPSRQNLFWVGIGSGLALAVHPIDDNVNARLVGSSSANRVFNPGKIIGETVTLLGTAVTIYAVGRAKDQPKVSHLGMDLIRSVVISEGLTQALKFTIRRERPDHSNHHSFPSGHAADTFAFATALERHLGWRGAVPAYVFSSYVAASRLHENRHFLSDVVFGAAVGIIAGRTVTRHGRENYPVEIALVRGGAAVMFVRHGD